MEQQGVAQKDDNGYSSLAGISCVDGVTVVPITFNATNRGMTVDTTTVISVTPKAITNKDADDFPVAKGVSTTNSKVVLPWYVNPTTGGVLMDIS